jgi:SAM-dependent MidA family methyltransferase
MTTKTLPTPSAEAKTHSEYLTQTIQRVIAQSAGKITFAQFMQHALYESGLGYYTAGAHKFGAEGDFVTAPEISPLFGYCLAEQCRDVLCTLRSPCILEFGAGTGKMALHILQHLQCHQQLPKTYYILEVSAELQQRQRALFAEHAPELLQHVQWLQQLPEKPFPGVILANEVIDAMPVHLVEFNDQKIEECYVSWDHQFTWKKNSVSQHALTQLVEPIQSQLNLAQHSYRTEFRPMLSSWLKSLESILSEGMVLLIDYGFPAKEYYHIERHQGTLMCHYRHHAHTNPFFLPGLQDITAHVDFTHLAKTAHSAGFHIAGYTTQAYFLLALGLLNFNNTENTEQQWQYNQQVKRLTLPSEMGELFKVMALTKNSDILLRGFAMRDMRERL